MGILFLSACEYATIHPDLPSPDQPVYYSSDIQSPIFNKKCAGCHQPGHSSGLDLTAANSYNSLMNGNFIDTINPSQSKLYTKMVTGHGNASATEAQLVLNWIIQGAKNN